MIILSYNINGLRSAIKKGFLDWIDVVKPDIICLQETKCLEQDIDIQAFQSKGYQFFLEPARRLGYSGVAILSKLGTDYISRGISSPVYQGEGRLIRLDFNEVSIVSIYVPSASTPERFAYKLEWLEIFEDYIKSLINSGRTIIVGGDFNIAHQPADVHNPFEAQNFTGFLPIERAYLDNLISMGLVDAFRSVNQNAHHYTWWSYAPGAKSNNLGWRLDYQFVSRGVQDKIKRCIHLKSVKFSDHCPVLLEIDL